MSAQELAFGVVAAVGTLSAVRMVTTKNVVHGALYLVVTLSMVGGAYLLLAAEFVAWVQIVIYVGAIVVLLLFSLMLTKAPIGHAALDNQQRRLGALIALAVAAGLIVIIQRAFSGIEFGPGDTGRVAAGKAQAVGASIFGHFVLPFEVVSVLLLAALIGAIALARRDEP